MLKKELLNQALKEEMEKMEEEQKRVKKVFGDDTEIVLIPVLVKERDGRVGSITYSDIMRTYNSLVRK